MITKFKLFQKHLALLKKKYNIKRISAFFVESFQGWGAIFYPKEYIKELRKFCNKNKISIVPQGGRTGLCGGTVPNKNGKEILLSTEKMDKVIEVSKDGFDFKNVNDCILKLHEEIQEFNEALKTNDKQKCLDEGGDILFASINVLRKAGINSQEALEFANNKFTRRYNYSEILAQKENKNFAETSLEEKHKYWLKSKKINL